MKMMFKYNIQYFHAIKTKILRRKRKLALFGLTVFYFQFYTVNIVTAQQK